MTEEKSFEIIIDVEPRNKEFRVAVQEETAIQEVIETLIRRCEDEGIRTADWARSKVGSSNVSYVMLRKSTGSTALAPEVTFGELFPELEDRETFKLDARAQVGLKIEIDFEEGEMFILQKIKGFKDGKERRIPIYQDETFEQVSFNGTNGGMIIEIAESKMPFIAKEKVISPVTHQTAINPNPTTVTKTAVRTKGNYRTTKKKIPDEVKRTVKQELFTAGNVAFVRFTTIENFDSEGWYKIMKNNLGLNAYDLVDIYVGDITKNAETYYHIGMRCLTPKKNRLSFNTREDHKKELVKALHDSKIRIILNVSRFALNKDCQNCKLPTHSNHALYSGLLADKYLITADPKDQFLNERKKLIEQMRDH